MAAQPIGPRHVILLSAGGVVCSVLILLSFYYAWVTTVAAVLVIFVTFVYVLFTYDALQVTQEQFKMLKIQNERQDRVLLFVDLSCEPPHLRLHIFNLGLSSFLVQKIVVKSSDDIHKPQTFDLHKIVESGKTETIKLPRDLWDGEDSTDFEFTVHYVGINDTGSTTPKSFNVGSYGSAVEDVEFVTITDGLDAPWIARCPKCDVPALTDVRGLKSFDVAEARRKQVEEDLALSCDAHKSDWILTVDKVKEEQKARENRRKL